MGDAGAVCLVEGVCDLNRNLERVVELDPPSGESCRERLAFQILQDDEVGSILGPDLGKHADELRLNRRDGLGLAFESRFQFWIGGGKDLDRNGAVQSRVACAVDLAHSAAADQRQDLVRAEASAGRQAHMKRPRYGCVRSANANSASPATM